MCELSNPIVRIGRVLSFSAPADVTSDFILEKEDARNFARRLWGANDDVHKKLSEVVLPEISDKLGKVELETQSDEFSHSLDEPQIFENNLVVVRFRDLLLQLDNEIVRVGLSCTVCEGDRKSKVWSRASCDTENLDTHELSLVFDRLNIIAELCCDALVSFYEQELKAYLRDGGKSLEFNLDSVYTFLIESGDYASDKLFDSVNTIRETGSLFDVFDENDWRPVRDLLEFSSSRNLSLLPAFELAKASDIDDNNIADIAKYFNQNNKGLSWDVTMGRYGLFTIEEEVVDKNSNTHLIHAVGICADQSRHRAQVRERTPSWIVSGNMAPKLGMSF